MLTLDRISKYHGSSPILVEVTVPVPPRARIGVVGPNGVGKSTLLRIAAGLEDADSGAITRNPASLTVGYMPQEADLRAGETLLGYLSRRTGVAAAEMELDQLTEALEEDPGLASEHADALDRFLAFGGNDLEAAARVTCAEVGLPAERLDVPTTALSGGEAARAALAAILLSRFDVLLLDEPTNNLDFEGLDRLEQFVTGLPGAVVVVSHDRAFLDRTVDRIAEIGEETHRVQEFAGGWSEYVEARALARRQHYEAHEKYRRERARLLERMRT